MSDPFQQKTNPSTNTAVNSYPNEAVRKVLEENQLVYETLGLSKKDLEAFYVTAKNLYDREKYKEALTLFQFFAFYNSDDKRAWMGIGACSEMLSNYVNAVMSYTMATGLAPEDPLPHFRLAHCWLAGKKTKQALQELEQVILLSAGKKKYAQLHESGLNLTQALSASV